MNEKPRLVKRLHSFKDVNSAKIAHWKEKNQKEYLSLFKNKHIISFQNNVSSDGTLKHLALVELPYFSDEMNRPYNKVVFQELFSSLTQKGIVPLDGRTATCVLIDVPHIVSDIFSFVDHLFIMGSTTQYKNREHAKPMSDFVSFFRKNEEDEIVLSNKILTLFLEEKGPHVIIALVSDDFIRQQQEEVNKKKQFAL